jgi:hypothetical protein
VCARVSVIVILIRALAHDVGRDLTLIVSCDVRRTVWLPRLACFVALFLLFLWRRLSAGADLGFDDVPHDAAGFKA